MNTYVVWILIAVSNGWYNQGTVTTVGHFATAEDCERVKGAIPVVSPRTGPNVIATCVQAKVVR